MRPIIKEILLPNLKGRLLYDEALARHTTFRIGGPAKYYFEPEDYSDLKDALDFCKNNQISHIVIGKGSNILFKDNGFDGMIIGLASGEFKRIILENKRIIAGAGTALPILVDFAIDHGFIGLEFLAGIPGSVGGSLIMNAGTKDKWIGDFVESVNVLTKENTVSYIEKKDLKFGYRSSNLSDYIIFEAVFLLEEGNLAESRRIYEKFLKEKTQNQDLSLPSAGCVFKNPPGESAGSLIERSSLKGKEVGGARVSNKHANFIVNKENAKADDVLKLIEIIQNKVKSDHGVCLELELKVI